jgi:hypothetical protein
LESARRETEKSIKNFLLTGHSRKEIESRFKRDVKGWNAIYTRRRNEIDNALFVVRAGGMYSGVREERELVAERNYLRANPPYVWLAELYASALESYLKTIYERTFRKHLGRHTVIG